MDQQFIVLYKGIRNELMIEDDIMMPLKNETKKDEYENKNENKKIKMKTQAFVLNVASLKL